jgi:autotransporter-associated beta strand protein
MKNMNTSKMIKWAIMLGVAIGIVAVTGDVRAVDYVWDADPDTPGIQNGAGTWNLTGTNWWDGANYVVWPNNNTTASAVLGNGSDAAGVINVDNSGVQIFGFGLTISQGGYVFQGDKLNSDNAGPLVLNAANGTTTFNNVLSVKNVSFAQENQTLVLNKGDGGGFAYGNNSLIGGTTVQIAKTSTVKLSGGLYGTQNSFLNIGDTTNNTGGLELLNTGTWVVTSALRVGRGAEGLLVINGGALTSRVVSGRDIYIADASGTGKILVKAGSLDTTGYVDGASIHAGLNGNGTLEVTGGNVNTGLGNIYIQSNNGATGAFKLTGGEVRASGIMFGYNAGNYITGNASFTQSGGALYVGANGINTSTGVTFNGLNPQIILSGGTLAASADWYSSLDMTLQKGDNGNVTFNAQDANFNDRTITLSGNLAGSGGLNISGGTLLLQGENSYQGQTVVSSGATLEIGGSQTIGLADLGNETAAFSGPGSLVLNANGSITINTSGAAGDSWILFDSSLLGNITYGNADWLTDFTNQGGGIWTWNDYSFNQGTGILSVIPEPSIYSLLIIGSLLLAVGSRTSRRV